MAINTNSGGKKAAPSTATTSAMAAGIVSNANDLIEMNVIKRGDAAATTTAEVTTATTTPILKRKGAGGSKRLKFSTPEYSVTPITNTAPRCVSPRLIPSRKRYEIIKYTHSSSSSLKICKFHQFIFSFQSVRFHFS